MLTISQRSASSFRDPAGRVAVIGNRIFRIVGRDGRANLNAYLNSPVVQNFVNQGRIVSSRQIEGAEAEDVLQALDTPSNGEWTVLEHERISFPSYACEWPAEMLAASARLTLDLAKALLPEGLGVKDSTPYNVLFRGTEPVFVDVLSIEPRRPTDPVWLPYAQFVRTMLLPLLANKYLGQPLNAIFITRRDGLEPEEVYAWTPAMRRLLPPFLTNVTLTKWLASKATAQEATLYRQREESPQKVKFILESLFRRLRRGLDKAVAEDRDSRWSEYTSQSTHYSSEQARLKAEFARAFLDEFRPRVVLDVGCNTGVFSDMAAAVAEEVVAIDYDPVVVGRLWQRAQREHKNILPLVVDLGRPTPSLGWRNQEQSSFLDRARGHFDAVLMLAVIHHMLVSERVPLHDVVSLASELTTDLWLVEWVGVDDPMFRRLARGREQLHSDLQPEVFERACSERFQFVRKQAIAGSSRILYIWRKRRG